MSSFSRFSHLTNCARRRGPEGDLRKIFRISVLSGIFGQVFGVLAGAGSAFLTKFAILLNAAPVHFGILAAIGQISQIFQPIGSFVTKRRTRRKGVVLALLFIGYAVAICFGVLPFVFPQGTAIYAFLLLFLTSVAFLSIANNAWIGWITGILPSRVRGRFFSILSQYMMITSVAIGIVFSIFIDSFAPPNSPDGGAESGAFFAPEGMPIGFAIVFLVAAAAGFGGVAILSRLPEREKRVEEGDAMRMFLLPFREGNFRKYLLFTCWWMLAVGIGAPFWQPFMLQKLGMSLFEVQLYGGMNIVAAVLVLRIWGRILDRYGNKTAMRIIIVLGGFNPMIWLFVNPQNYHILYLEAITSGTMWAGAGLVATNFVLSIAPDEKRQIYSGISGAFSGLAIVMTMLASGLLLPPPFRVGDISLHPEQVLFGLSGIARWSAQIPLSFVRDRKTGAVGEAIAFFIRELKPRILK